MEGHRSNITQECQELISCTTRKETQSQVVRSCNYTSEIDKWQQQMAYLLRGLGVQELVSEGPTDQVGPLAEVEHAAQAAHSDLTTLEANDKRD